MRRNNGNCLRKIYGAAALLILAAGTGWAAIQVVQFGGNLGFVYSPSNFTATVGDTVQWIGDFSVHPLSSTTIPTGAQSWHNGGGTSFQYVIKVAGTYHYQCDVHFSIGMTGSFTANGSGVKNLGQNGRSLQNGVFLLVNTGNPRMPSITYGVPQAGPVRVEVFDLLGNSMSLAVFRRQEAGMHSVPLDARFFPAGIYFVRLTCGETELVRAIRLAK
ncbi:MAG TPA: plastocyanin/azurin family copper-binding protein [Chitinivibrionales bacterium]|nr:plastocyanin/azurin family copper-binding protein [Chitinivibrionales bacterium]